jgi:hypothetical protein
MKYKQPTNNTEFLTQIMNFSKQGAMMQMFIMEAIRYYSEAVKENPIDDNGFINPEAWSRCANEFLEQLDAFHNRSHTPEETLVEEPEVVTVQHP